MKKGNILIIALITMMLTVGVARGQTPLDLMTIHVLDSLSKSGMLYTDSAHYADTAAYADSAGAMAALESWCNETMVNVVGDTMTGDLQMLGSSRTWYLDGGTDSVFIYNGGSRGDLGVRHSGTNYVAWSWYYDRIVASQDVYLAAGSRLYGYDATAADTFFIYDDGDTTRFESDNPIKIGDASLIISSGGDVSITGELTVGDGESAVNIVDAITALDTTLDTMTTGLWLSSEGSTQLITPEQIALRERLEIIATTANSALSVENRSNGIGVSAQSMTNTALYGTASGAIGVYGTSGSTYGGYFVSTAEDSAGLYAKGAFIETDTFETAICRDSSGLTIAAVDTTKESYAYFTGGADTYTTGGETGEGVVSSGSFSPEDKIWLYYYSTDKGSVQDSFVISVAPNFVLVYDTTALVDTALTVIGDALFTRAYGNYSVWDSLRASVVYADSFVGTATFADSADKAVYADSCRGAAVAAYADTSGSTAGLWTTVQDTLAAYPDTSVTNALNYYNDDSVTALVYATVWDSLSADTFIAGDLKIYDKGDTIKFDSSNPIVIGDSALVISESGGAGLIQSVGAVFDKIYIGGSWIDYAPPSDAEAQDWAGDSARVAIDSLAAYMDTTNLSGMVVTDSLVIIGGLKFYGAPIDSAIWVDNIVNSYVDSCLHALDMDTTAMAALSAYLGDNYQPKSDVLTQLAAAYDSFTVAAAGSVVVGWTVGKSDTITDVR